MILFMKSQILSNSQLKNLLKRKPCLYFSILKLWSGESGGMDQQMSFTMSYVSRCLMFQGSCFEKLILQHFTLHQLVLTKSSSIAS